MSAPSILLLGLLLSAFGTAQPAPRAGTPGSAAPATGTLSPGERAAFRRAALQGCMNPSPDERHTMEEAGIPIDQFCTCAIDHYIQKTADARVDPGASTTPEASRLLQEAAAHCVEQLLPPANPRR